jgi:hypothetical protein
MLIIKTLMVAGSLILFSYFFIAARGRPLEKLGMSLVFMGIAFFALFPELSDRIANFVGVDRGADLMLYLATMALLFLCFNLYLGQKQIQSEMVAVVRAIGLLTAQEQNGREGSSAIDPVHEGNTDGNLPD